MSYESNIERFLFVLFHAYFAFGPTVPYNDGTKKIFLYTKGTEGNPSQELRDMLKYLEKTNDENVTNQDINTIHHFVKKVKHRKEVGISYMKSWEIDRANREEGRREGLEEGRREGLEEGRREGLENGIIAMIETCQELGQSQEETASILSKKFTIPPERIKQFIIQYWKES